MRIDIIEKTGLLVDGKQMALGDGMDNVKNMLGEYEVYDDSYYFFDGDLLILTDNSGHINEIEVRSMDDEETNVFFREKEIFKEEKESVLEYLSACNGETLLTEDNCEYYANNLGVVIYFEITEEDVEEMIRESKADGVYEEMLEEIEQDIYRSKYIGSLVIKQGRS